MRKVRILNRITGFLAELISLKSASIPASAIRNINPRDPRELIRELKWLTVAAGGVPKKARGFERTNTNKQKQ